VDSPLGGQHQQRNLALAIASALELRSHHGYNISNSAIEAGIRQTVWPGRFEHYPASGGRAPVLLDVGHNPAGAWALRAALSHWPEEAAPRTLIFSCLRDKPIAELAQILFPLFDRILLTPVDSPRSASLSELSAAAEPTGTVVDECASPVAAGGRHPQYARWAWVGNDAEPGGSNPLNQNDLESPVLAPRERTRAVSRVASEDVDDGLPSPELPPLGLAARLRSNLIQTPIFALTTGLFGSVALAASLIDKDGRMQHAIAHRWAKCMAFIAGAPVTVIGKDNLTRYPVAVYASNHLSYMDTPVLFGSLPFQFRILARHNLWQLPFIGWYLDRSGQIPVNADNPRASIASLNAGAKALKAGMPLVVFPEGGRSVDGRLKDFMSGPAFMAIKAQVPLVPMALVGTHELFPMHTHHFRPRPVKLVVGEPIATTGMHTRDANQLTEQLRKVIEQLYYDHADRRPGPSQP
jgi:1-acyl-sn-glycerol-3-phosphate acyltransferase